MSADQLWGQACSQAYPPPPPGSPAEPELKAHRLARHGTAQLAQSGLVLQPGLPPIFSHLYTGMPRALSSWGDSMVTSLCNSMGSASNRCGSASFMAASKAADAWLGTPYHTCNSGGGSRGTGQCCQRCATSAGGRLQAAALLTCQCIGQAPARTQRRRLQQPARMHAHMRQRTAQRSTVPRSPTLGAPRCR